MNPTRANDPETGLPYASPNALHKLVGWFWTKYSRKTLLKISVIAAPVISGIASTLGHTPSSVQAIGIGLSALVLGALDFIISYVGKKMGFTNLESLQKLSEQQEQPAIPFTSDSGTTSTRSIMWEEARRVGMLSPSQIKADEEALAEFRANLRPLNPVPVIPKGDFAVESWDKDNGEPTVTYYDTKFQAVAFRDAQRLNNLRANML